MLLEEYWKKRHFDRTPEPRGGKIKHKSGSSFVIQKHAATRLHYDFRLEMGGVLKSWAVPKGPSYDPTEKRLAVHVEDHPIEYGAFEGIIPQHEYGGGTVMLWDHGTWEPEGDALKSYEKGTLKFSLRGEKLRGRWALVRMGRKPAKGEKENWLLIKERDEYAEPGSKDGVVEAFPLSVVTQRSLDEIAAEVGEKTGRKRAPGAKPKKVLPKVSQVAHTPSVPMPAFIQPQLATLVDRMPPGEDWIHEIKYDGYRILARIDRGTVTLFTRNENDWSAQLPSLVQALKQMPVEQAWLDGEIVRMDSEGKTSFGDLQDALSRGADGELDYFVFDLMFFDGHDLRKLPLIERKKLLEPLIAATNLPSVRYSDHIVGAGDVFQRHACKLALEGVISKRPAEPYRSRRSRDWVKVKCLQRQEFVIGGFSDGAGTRNGFGALLLGVYEDGELRYAGRVGTGFTAQSLADLTRQLQAIEQPKSPFSNSPKGAMARGVHWVKPELVAEVAFTNWTGEGVLRHPSFQGLRRDKSARQAIREQAEPAPQESSAVQKSRATANAKPRKKEDAEDAVAGITLSNPTRVLFTEGCTKRDLARYYAAIENWVLPHVANRPLTLVRCPEGTGKSCFFQKHANEKVPDVIKRVDVSLAGDKEPPYLWIDSLAGLIALVQMGVLEVHTWGSSLSDVNKPDRIIFDLDPDPGVAWERIVEASLLVRNRLEDLGLTSFVKTTGGKGVHVVAPVKPELGWDEVKAFTKRIADDFASEDPSRFTAKMSKALRKDRIFIDYLRNGRGATAVAAYSARAKPRATVSVPITWEELVVDRVKPDQFTIASLPKRLQKLKGDPWAEYDSVRQSLRSALKKLK